MRAPRFEDEERVIWSGNRGRIHIVTGHLGWDRVTDEPMYAIEQLDKNNERAGLSATTAHEHELKPASR